MRHGLAFVFAALLCVVLGVITNVVWANVAWAGRDVQASDPAPFIVVQSTTSTQNSGLFDYLLPLFETHSGIKVRVVAVGSGQALRNAANGDGDVVFVHAKASEEAFVAAGDGVARFDVMYNDFVIVGPGDDPVGIADAAGSAGDVTRALERIAKARAPFVSRGDDSGTHQAERRLWGLAGFDPTPYSGQWYLETGAGMGAALNIATAMGAYVMTDRATWVSFGNRRGHRILVAGDARLFNQYGVILVNPQKHPHVKAKSGRAFIDWLLSREGQDAIAAYRIRGQQVFFPNAR